jgi:hypothetical protein
MTEFPVTIADFLTLAGLSVFAVLVLQWPVKPALELWLRHREWAEEDKADAYGLLVTGLCVAICLGAAILATFILADWRPEVATVFESSIMAFFAAMTAAGLYEAGKNVVRAVTNK